MHTTTSSSSSTARGLRGVFFGMVLALASSAALTAWAQADAAPGSRQHAMHGGRFGHGPLGHLDRMLDAVNASDAQRSQVRQIAQAVAADMKAQHEAGRALRERQRALLAAPTIDANAIESVRQQMMTEHDQASRRMTQAMIDVSRVLTPEQRAQWAAQTQARRELMQRQRQERRQLGHPQQG